MSSADSQAAHVRAVAAAGGVVDSILPMDEQLRRFRADLGAPVDSLRNAQPSINALVRRWAAAVSARDTSTLNALLLDRAEFAWLYFPGSKLSKPPYEAPPQLLWAQILANSEGGAQQLLKRFGGARLDIVSVNCAAPTDTTANSIVHSACEVRGRTSAGEVREKLFGSIVEHNGQFKFLGYANSL